MKQILPLCNIWSQMVSKCVLFMCIPDFERFEMFPYKLSLVGKDIRYNFSIPTSPTVGLEQAVFDIKLIPVKQHKLHVLADLMQLNSNTKLHFWNQSSTEKAGCVWSTCLYG